MNNHFKIIIPLYNVSEWISKCITSVIEQEYRDFQCIVIDDISTDNSTEIIKDLIKDDDRFLFIQNTEKSFALKNIYEGIQTSCPKDEDVIVTLDGDDWFASTKVLSILNSVYKINKCWLTYGSYMDYPNGNKGVFARQAPSSIVEDRSFRQHEWCFSHLRTFKYHLWKQIKREDLLDKEGNFYRMAWDLAFMFPMLEMAGKKSQYIDDILYVYNCANPLNDHKIDNAYQMSLEREIRSKKSYAFTEKSGAHNLLNANRFDIAAKIIYLKSLIKGTDKNFGEEIYLEHLRVWNGLNEINPPKNSADDFLNAFKDISKSIQELDFDQSISKVPVINGSPINGAHRIASCIVHNKNVKTYDAAPSEGQYMCNYEYFKNKKDIGSQGLSSIYLDEMALEFCRTKNNLFTISIFPSHNVSFDQIFNLVKQKYAPVYSKEIDLTEQGKLNYIHNLYCDESWIGSKNAGYPGVKEKARLCFSNGNNVRVVLVEENDVSRLNELKQQIRSMCNAGNHSVHMNDTQEETWRIASCAFNNQSIDFINNRVISSTPNFDTYFDKYREIMKSRKDSEDFCIDSSAVLSAYGLRDCRDLDFLHLKGCSDLYPKIECHNNESHHYAIEKDDIICCPKNHFYFFGIKMACLEVVKNMKLKRSEEKDRADLELIG